MAGYRLFIFSMTGHIARPVELDCPDDDEAVWVAQEHAKGRYVELWQMNRLVRKLGEPPKRGP